MKLEHTKEQEQFDTMSEQQDNNYFYKVEELKGTIFRKAISDNETLYLLGDSIIAKLETNQEKEVTKTESELKELNTRLLVPFIAAVVEKVTKHMELLKTQKQ